MSRIADAAQAGVPYACVAIMLVAAWTFFEPVCVSGDSMAPGLRSGDLAVVRRGSPCGRGDIALIREPGRGAVLHRVVRTGPDGTLVTKGDANPTVDLSRARSEWVTGRVVTAVPVGRLLARWHAAPGSDTLSAQSDRARR